MDIVTLNDEQLAADAQIESWLADDDGICFTLMGSAGTGKTTLVSHMFSRWEAERSNVVYLAPTHRAVAVMKEKLQVSGLDDRCFTIAKGANQVLAKDDIQPYLVRRGGKNRLFRGAAIIVVDESSWVDDKTYETLISEAEEYVVKILFVGDPYQLPPPKAKATWPMFQEEESELFELRKVVRQREDSPIIKNAQRLRKAIAAGSLRTPRIRPGLDDHGRGVHLIHADAALGGIVSSAREHSKVCMFAWRRDRVRYWSRKIRRELYGVKPGGYWVPGESVTNTRYVTGPDGTYLYSHQHSTVVSIGESHVHEEYGLEYTDTLLQPEGDAEPFLAKDVASTEALQALLDRYYAAAKAEKRYSAKARVAWLKFHKLNEEFANLTTVYVSTVHSAQGQTLDVAWLDADDIYAARKRPNGLDQVNRMVYVGITRASNSVYMASEIYK